MRLNKRDLDLLAEAYDDMSGPRGMEDNTSEDVEDDNSVKYIIKKNIGNAKKAFVNQLMRDIDGELSMRRQTNAGTRQELDALKNQAYDVINDMHKQLDEFAFDVKEEDAEGFASPIKIDINDVEDLEVDGVDPRDYPDFSDAYFSNGSINGRPLTDDELEYLTNTYGVELNRAAHDSFPGRYGI
jgi:hypothetical protein